MVAKAHACLMVFGITRHVLLDMECGELLYVLLELTGLGNGEIGGVIFGAAIPYSLFLIPAR